MSMNKDLVVNKALGDSRSEVVAARDNVADRCTMDEEASIG